MEITIVVISTSDGLFGKYFCLLISMIRASLDMQIEASMGMCHTFLLELGSEKHNGDNSRKHDEKAQKLRSNPKFQAVTEEIELQHRRGFSLHPKMEMLKRLLIQHFGERMDDGSGPHEGTRAMVFVTYRECIDEIVDMFDVEKPLIRATRFVGQGTDKQGKKGYGQKEQLEVRQWIFYLLFALV
jgi:ATP-dependent DNA helicase MPH1